MWPKRVAWTGVNIAISGHGRQHVSNIPYVICIWRAFKSSEKCDVNIFMYVVRPKLRANYAQVLQMYLSTIDVQCKNLFP